MKITIVALLVRMNINPQKYGNELYTDALNMFMDRMDRMAIGA